MVRFLSSTGTAFVAFWSVTVILLTHPKEGLCVTAWGKTYPAVLMDYKIKIEARSEFCYFQSAYNDSVFYIDFHVIRGGVAGFVVKDPNGVVVLQPEWQQRKTYTTDKALAGDYSICIDNHFNRYSDIVVSVFMSTYQNLGWERYVGEADAMEISARILTTSLFGTQQRLTTVLQFLHHTKSKEAVDYEMLLYKDYNFSFWSVTHCSIILVSGCVQVYLIRRLFQENPSVGKYRARL